MIKIQMNRAAFLVIILLASNKLAYSDEVHCPQNANDTDSTEFYNALSDNDQGTVETFLNKNPNLVFSKDYDCNTPLHIAVSMGNIVLTKMVLFAQGGY